METDPFQLLLFFVSKPSYEPKRKSMVVAVAINGCMSYERKSMVLAVAGAMGVTAPLPQGMAILKTSNIIRYSNIIMIYLCIQASQILYIS